MTSTVYEAKVWYYAVDYTKLPVPITVDLSLTAGELAKAISIELRELPGNFVLYKVSPSVFKENTRYNSPSSLYTAVTTLISSHSGLYPGSSIEFLQTFEPFYDFEDDCSDICVVAKKVELRG